MTLVDQPYSPARHWHALRTTLLAARAIATADRYPTAHRLELLLASRLWDPQRNARIWLNATGQCAGFAALTQRQRGSAALGYERVLAPAEGADSLEQIFLDWVLARAGEIATELGEPVTLGASAHSDEAARITAFERSGFTLYEGYNVYMGRTLGCALPAARLLVGYTIRPLAATDTHELAVYTELYQRSFTPVDPALHQNLLRDPDYAHLVAVAPDGSLVAFCEYSICRDEWALGGRRTGWIDYLGTREDLRGRGLGQALLLAAFAHMQSWGAEQVALITIGTNERAQRVYRKMGMDILERDLIYTRRVG